jgi:hypothetical protein
MCVLEVIGMRLNFVKACAAMAVVGAGAALALKSADPYRFIFGGWKIAEHISPTGITNEAPDSLDYGKFIGNEISVSREGIVWKADSGRIVFDVADLELNALKQTHDEFFQYGKPLFRSKFGFLEDDVVYMINVKADAPFFLINISGKRLLLYYSCNYYELRRA